MNRWASPAPAVSTVLGMAVLTIGLVLGLACASPAIAESEAPQADAPEVEDAAEAPDAASPRRAAIFVRNRADATLDAKVGVLEELLTARISGAEGFSVISRENVINAVSEFADDGASAGTDGPVEQELDRLLSDRTSALRLGQLMNADYVLIASLTTFNQTTRTVRAYDVEHRVRQERLRASYQVLDATGDGGTLAASTVTADLRTRLNDGFEQEPDNLDDLIDDVAGKLAEALLGQVQRDEIRRAQSQEAELAMVTLTCTIEDVMIPDVVRDEDDEWIVSDERRPMEVMDVTIELNGVVEGTTPATLRLPPGLSRLRLSREGFRDWERTINVRDGMDLSVALTLTEENRQRTREDLAFFEELRRQQKLTDAQVEVLRGKAQMFEQSGFRVDVQKDITVDTDEAPRIEKNVQSFWAN